MYVKNVRELDVYKLAFEAAMKVFRLSKKFPKEELYSMTAQARNSSRSVCTCLSEGWRKRRYVKVFTNKISDSAQEADETQTWLDFALAHEYVTQVEHAEVFKDYDRILSMLSKMEMKAGSFCFKPGEAN